jgi:uncharacterized protein
VRRDEALALLVAQREALARLGVRSLSIFGSVARDEAGPESDVDVLVEFLEAATLERYMALKWFLETLFGRPVDLATPGALKPGLQRRIAGDLIHVA